MKKRKVIANLNLPLSLSLFLFKGATVWILLDRFDVSKSNQVWIGSIFMILFVLLAIAKTNESKVNIFKDGE